MRFSRADLAWDALDEDVRAYTRRLVRDVVACAASGSSLAPYPDFVTAAPSVSGETASVWFQGLETTPSYAALVNGAIAHHADMDDGHAAASVHGGVVVVPAAVAVAESAGSSPEACLSAIVAGYATAIAFGRRMRAACERERAHPPGVVGAFGAAAASACLLGLDEEGILDAVCLAGSLAPLAPFESFTRGATVKDLYAGWPALTGVEAAFMARDGLAGPRRHFEVDSLRFDPRELRDVYLKRWASCRSTHAALTAASSLLPVDVSRLDTVEVETYPFAWELSRDAAAATPIGAKASIPATLACLLIEGRVDPDAFTLKRLRARRSLSERVDVRGSLPRGARVTFCFDDGSRRTGAAEAPQDETEPRDKFDRLMKGKSLDVELLRRIVA